MAYPPNYGQQRQDRDRSKNKKAQAKLDRLEEKALQRKRLAQEKLAAETKLPDKDQN